MENKKIIVPETLSQKERDFCELLIFGVAPYTGNPRKCYEELFNVNSLVSRKYASELMERADVKEYLTQLRIIANYNNADLKSRLTEKLLHIIDETSTSVYTDRRGTVLSPAPLRSVAVQAAKALMDLYPLRVAQENKLELSGGDSNTGITFNVIVPQKEQENTEQ